MKLMSCPVCHSAIHLEALVEDEAGRELLGLLPTLGECAKPAVNYLGLFRPAKSNLSNTRALKILKDLLDLYPCSNLLAHALSETVEQIRRNRREGGRVEPLANHNYLKKVYEGARPQFAVVRAEGSTKAHSPDQQQREADEKRHNAIMYIERFKTLGQLDAVKHTAEYKIWEQWQKEKVNATAD